MYSKTTKVIGDQLAEKVFPGVDYAFYKKGQLIRETLGYAQIVPEKEILKADMLFDMASLTKVICTTTVLLKSFERGLLEWDQPLRQYLPAFDDPQVTLRHLLTHTADINPYIENRGQLSGAQLREAFYHLRSGEKRGEEVAYTDTGTILLGFLLEEIYGEPLQQIFQKEVLMPLAMTASTFTPKSTNCAATEFHDQRGVIRGAVHDPKAYTLGEHCGSAGLFSNVSDVLKFAKMLLNKGKIEEGQLFLQAATIQNLLKDHTPNGKLKRSLGWDLKYDFADEHPMLFHTGYTGTFLLVDVLQNEAFIFLSNRVHPHDYRKEYLAQRDQLIQIYLKEKAQKI